MNRGETLTSRGLLVAVVLTMSGEGRAQSTSLIADIVDASSTEYMESVVRTLSGESPVWIDGREVRIETRYSGTEGMHLSSLFLAEELERCGLDLDIQEYLGWGLEDVAFADGNDGWIVGERGVILRTEDGGDHWVRQGAVDDHLYGIEVISSEWAVAVGAGGAVYRTEDGGRRWEPSAAGTRTLRGVAFVDSLNGWVCGDKGNLFRTRDGGVTWESLESPDDSRLRSVAFVDTSRGWVVGDNGLVIRSVDGGRSWETLLVPDPLVLYATCFLDSLTGWTAGEGGRTWRTDDGGASWQGSGVESTVTVHEIVFHDSNRGWAVGSGGVLLETTDGGTSWTTTSPGFPADLRGVYIGDSRRWAVGNQTLIMSDGGGVWRRRTETVEGLWVNVQASLPGTVFPDESYVICGHFDSISELPALRAPGADDNASGTALVLTAARALSRYRFERTLTFVCFSGEEQGLRGSFSYVADLLGSKTTPAGVINADMVAYDTGRERRIWIHPGDRAVSRSLAEVCSTVVGEYDLDLVASLPQDVYGQSDHMSFSEFGVPAVMVSEANATDYPFIHTVGDRIEHLNMEFAGEVARLAVAAAATLASPIGRAAGSALEISRASPNPFRDQMVIHYSLPSAFSGRVRLAVYDVRGRLLNILVDDLVAGGDEIHWDGKNREGRQVGPGIYFLRLEAGSRTATSKIARVR